MHKGIYIKRLRKNKCYTQKYVGEGVLSQSAYSKFEAGISDIHSEAFIQILDRLDMSLEEVLYISNGYCLKEVKDLVHSFFSLPYNNLDSLHQLVVEIEQYPEYENNILLNDIRTVCFALIELYATHDILAARTIVEPVWKRLSLLNNWYLTDIRLINSILYLFPNDTAIELTRNVLKQLDRYKGFQDSGRLMITFKINLSLLLIKEKNFEVASDILTDALIKHKKEMLFSSLAICLGRLSICNHALGKSISDDYLNQAEQLLKIYDHEDLWRKIKEEYTYYCNLP